MYISSSIVCRMTSIACPLNYNDDDIFETANDSGVVQSIVNNIIDFVHK